MSGYPSLTLKSHTVSSSVTDSFVKPAEEAHWLGALVSKLRNLLVNPSLFGLQVDKVEHRGAIICASWHPSRTDQIAFGMSDGVVQVSMQPSTKPIPLKHQHQRDISCVAWQPNSVKMLSVGCAYGIIVWEVVAQKGSILPSRTTLHETRTPVTSLSYTPDGRQCLATTHSFLLLLDTITGEAPVCIRSISHPSFVAMSPEYCLSFLADGHSRFHILRGITEGSESFTRLSAPVSCAVWSPSASHLLFTLARSSLVLVLEMFNPKEINSKISSQAQIFIDLHKTASYSEGESWTIEDMAMDDAGQKLALLARDTTSDIAKIFLFGLCLRSNSVFESDVVGEGMSPTKILYQHNSQQGALLCVCCENGTVNFITESGNPS